MKVEVEGWQWRWKPSLPLQRVLLLTLLSILGGVSAIHPHTPPHPEHLPLLFPGSSETCPDCQHGCLPILRKGAKLMQTNADLKYSEGDFKPLPLPPQALRTSSRSKHGLKASDPSHN